MATLIAKGVAPTTTPLDEFNSKEGKFKDVAEFGLSNVKEYVSKPKPNGKGNNKYFQCENLAFVQPGQFVRLLLANENLKFGKVTKLENGTYDLELFEDENRETLFMLDADGLLHIKE